MAFATSYHTPSPKVLGKSGGGRRKTAGASAKRIKTATKTPLSTLLKKASENRVLRDAKLVSMCNHVLASAGLVATVRTPNDVRAVCASTSVLIASYEAVVGEKISGIIRRPANVEERARNCDLVIHRLQENVLGTDLKHISGQRITQGNLQDTYDLLEILAALGEKWTFATPIKTPSSKRHFGAALTSTTARKRRENQSQSAGRAPLPSSLKKKLLLDDEDSKPTTAAFVSPSTKTTTPLGSGHVGVEDEEEEVSPESGKTLKEKLQDLLVHTVEQKQKALKQKSSHSHGGGGGEHERPSVRFEGYHSQTDEEADEYEEEESHTANTEQEQRNQDRTKLKTTSANKKKKFVLATKTKGIPSNKSRQKNPKKNKNSSDDDGHHRGDVREMAEMLLVHDKVGQYVEFDRAIRKLAEMKMSTSRLNHRQFALEEKKVVDSEQRMRLMRHLWLKNQRAQQRHQLFIEEKRHQSSQRSLLHSARVESIKARRFQQRVEELRTSHESRYESAEVQVFRSVFNKAVEVEKDQILENRKQQSRELKENNEAKKLRRVTIAREEKLRKHFEELTEQFKQELLGQRRLEREDDLIKRMYEREERGRITEEREKAMEHLAPFKSGAFDTIAIKGNQVESMKVGVKHYMRKVSAMVS